jgi:exonuclease VII small subunit
MENKTNNLLTTTAFLFTMSFGTPIFAAEDNQIEGIEQAESWQSFEQNQLRLEQALKEVKNAHRLAGQEIERLQFRIEKTDSAKDKEALYTKLQTIQNKTGHLNQQVEALAQGQDSLHSEKAAFQRTIKQFERKHKPTEELELQVISLWQQYISVGVEQLALQQQVLAYKHQATALMTEYLAIG